MGYEMDESLKLKAMSNVPIYASNYVTKCFQDLLTTDRSRGVWLSFSPEKKDSQKLSPISRPLGDNILL